MKADFLLFDSWFATNQFLHSVHRKGVHSIAMVKDFNSMQFLVGREDGTKKRMKLSGLYGKVNSVFGKKDILGSVLVEVDNGKNSPEPPLPVKVVFVRNRKSGAKREWLAIPARILPFPTRKLCGSTGSGIHRGLLQGLQERFAAVEGVSALP